MKKILCALLGATLVSACATWETDMDKTQAQRAQRRAENRAVQGCTALDEHGTYRQCIIDTYYASRPRTYTTTRLPNGQPLAIMGRGHNNAFIETEQNIVTRTYETSSRPTVSQVYRIETVVPETVVVTGQAPIVYQYAEPIPVQTVVRPKEPTREKTWWETYQADRKPVTAPMVKCPCSDPNVPCPQCNPK